MVTTRLRTESHGLRMAMSLYQPRNNHTRTITRERTNFNIVIWGVSQLQRFSANNTGSKKVAWLIIRNLGSLLCTPQQKVANHIYDGQLPGPRNRNPETLAVRTLLFDKAGKPLFPSSQSILSSPKATPYSSVGLGIEMNPQITSPSSRTAPACCIYSQTVLRATPELKT